MIEGNRRFSVVPGTDLEANGGSEGHEDSKFEITTTNELLYLANSTILQRVIALMVYASQVATLMLIALNLYSSNSGSDDSTNTKQMNVYFFAVFVAPFCSIYLVTSLVSGFSNQMLKINTTSYIIPEGRKLLSEEYMTVRVAIAYTLELIISYGLLAASIVIISQQTTYINVILNFVGLSVVSELDEKILELIPIELKKNSDSYLGNGVKCTKGLYPEMKILHVLSVYSGIIVLYVRN